ncbi:uncharacterized protein J4E79_005491 [Alternaria viburni]|uniref:uncharacterized protein n=1 Tax=Alternaria viburni TaxID=566460 RepID=UPI0020C2A848|nr:uncharacterized protein J4E79_005491 [Alternaria viburni]KAI4660923.1 hypothetical protein J4E79_005491 [Alternaria viburni]
MSPRYSPIEQLAVERWREQVSYRVKARIALCQTCKPDAIQKANNERPPKRKRTEHDVFQIPELLDMILQFAGPEAQVRALLLSTAWRTSAISVLRSPTNVDAFRTLPVYALIDYGQIIDWESETPLRPSTDEVAQFCLHLARIRDKPCHPRAHRLLYFPAYFAQSPDLPDTVTHYLNGLDVAQRGEPHIDVQSVTRDANLYWLDLSQFRINPYFEMLFSDEDRFKHHLGRWEISLRVEATSNSLLIDDSISNQLLVQAIKSMQIVHPPCKSLGIYYYDHGRFKIIGTHLLMRRLRREDGIRVIDLVRALSELAPALLSTWTRHAERLRDQIKDAHWIDDLWKVPGKPRFRICLDNTDMPDDYSPENLPRAAFVSRESAAVDVQLGMEAHITRQPYMFAEQFRGTREGEWLPKELFEPMKSETARHPIEWNK